MAKIAPLLIDAEIQEDEPSVRNELAGAQREKLLPFVAPDRLERGAFGAARSDHVHVVAEVARHFRNVMRCGCGEGEVEALGREDLPMKGGAGGVGVNLVELRIIALDVGLI